MVTHETRIREVPGSNPGQPELDRDQLHGTSPPLDGSLFMFTLENLEFQKNRQRVYIRDITTLTPS